MVTTTQVLLIQRQQPEFADGLPEPYRRDLLPRAIGGDAIAYARLYDVYADRVYGYMYFHVRNEAMAEDLAARVFLKAWRTIPCYQPERAPFSVWLYLVARNALIEFSREQRDISLVKEIISPADEGLELYEPVEPCVEA